MSTVQLRGLRRTYGSVVALDHLDLNITSGEFVSLLGPSGCGKTTALRIVAGFDWPDSGDVLVDGHDVLGQPANKRDMGMVFQAYSLFPNMTAQQNVEFGLRIRKQHHEQRSKRARELLELVGLGSAMDRYPRQMSGGQQQRVALARSLAIEPKVLLLDEPLSALDAKVRVQLREEVRRIQLELGITTIYVTHDQEEALSISDRVAVMSAGRVEQLGTPAQIYSGPRTAFVANFVGTMNKIEGVVVSRQDRSVRCGPVTVIVADQSFSHAAGETVDLYIRPEDVRVTLLADGARPPAGSLEGRVTSLTFLGPVTRVGLQTALGTLLSDVSSAVALDLAADTPVAVELDSSSLRSLVSADSLQPVEAAADPNEPEPAGDTTPEVVPIYGAPMEPLAETPPPRPVSEPGWGEPLGDGAGGPQGPEPGEGSDEPSDSGDPSGLKAADPARPEVEGSSDSAPPAASR
jgi:putative spermidine/putrescine transport system ATP-binding protein